MKLIGNMNNKKYLLIILSLFILFSIISFGYARTFNSGKVILNNNFNSTGSLLSSENLNVGDTFYLDDGRKARVTGIEDVVNNDFNNLNFFANGVLVHNKNRKLPFGFTSEAEFTQFERDTLEQINLLPINRENARINLMGSGVSGISSEFSRNPGRYFVRDALHDYDVGVLLNDGEFNRVLGEIKADLEKQVLSTDSRMVKLAEIDLKKVCKSEYKGFIDSYLLKRIASDHNFEKNLVNLGKKYGVKKIQVGVINIGGRFDNPPYIPIE